MQSKFKAMIFDMDGTLLDSMWYWRTIWREYMDAEHLPLFPEQKGKITFGSGMTCQLLSRAGHKGGDYWGIYLDMLERFLAPHYRNDVWPKPFAEDMLRMLKRQGYPVAVASATPRHIARMALERHDLLKYVDFVTDCQETGFDKSDPQFFQAVAQRMNVPIEECVVFEDAVYAIRSAKTAGAHVVAIDEPISWPHRDEIQALCDRYIRHWGELTGTGVPRKYRNIVLDFGNVIGRFDFDLLISLFCENADDVALIKAAVSPEWVDLDAGLTPYDEYITRALSRLPERLHAQAKAFFYGWLTGAPYVEGMPKLIESLKKRHYKLFLLSNAPVPFAENLSHYDVLDGFTGFVVSGPIRMLKPDPEIYEYLIKNYALDPARTLFVDDTLRNVEGARAVGIDAYHFDGDADRLAEFIKASEN